MPKLLSRMYTSHRDFANQSRRDQRANIIVAPPDQPRSELVRHRAAADDHADPDDERERTANARAKRRAAARIPLRHSRIEDRVIEHGIDTQQQEEYQLRAKEPIGVRLS